MPVHARAFWLVQRAVVSAVPRKSFLCADDMYARGQRTWGAAYDAGVVQQLEVPFCIRAVRARVPGAMQDAMLTPFW
eukprot:6192311-Pleurochrysis_carterae.AAC.6